MDGIDIVNRRYIKNFLLDYVQKNDALVILSSHTMDDIKDICDNLILLKDKNVCLQYDVDSFKNNYITIQILADRVLTKEYFIENEIPVVQIKTLDYLCWISIKNDEELVERIRELDFKDIRIIKSTIEEVLYYEIIS